ncbi:nicotinamide riboside transporter PnuC [Lactococcus lactis]|uniref:nicotinamide riboside transporter PnuC n=1 Tax=Lactococcus lactis TaxID=1358 RepID=UPI0022A7FCFB|nr:nicotinamide riboside transporter PnuC [Lactococcus lactis]
MKFSQKINHISSSYIFCWYHIAILYDCDYFKKLGGVQIWLDAALFPLAIVGQILMTFGYRSQWVAWNIINIINIIIWYNQFMVNGTSISLSMLMLQIVMFLNSIYGSIIWLKKSKSYTI